MEQILYALLIFAAFYVGIYSIYWLLVRPVLLKRFRFEVERAKDDLRMLRVSGFFGKDQEAFDILMKRANATNFNLDRIDLLSILWDRRLANSKEMRVMFSREEDIIRLAGSPVEKLAERLSNSLFGAFMLNSPNLIILLLLILGLSFWVGRFRDLIQETFRFLWEGLYVSSNSSRLRTA